MTGSRFAAALSLLLFAFPVLAQGPDTKLTIKPLNDHVYAVLGGGGNTGVSVGADGVLVIDTKVPSATAALIEAVNGITDKPVRLVVNTHFHYDHVSGNAALAERGAVIVSHDNVRRRLRANETAPAGLPDVTYDSALTIHFNGDTIRVIHPRHAHTDGDSFLYLQPSNILFMGDVYFASGYPFIDLEHGGSVPGYIAAVEKALAIADGDTIIVPGHGPVSDRQSLERYHHMLTTLAGRVRELMTQGKSLEAIQAAGVTESFDPRWGGGFISADEFVKTLYTSLKES